MVCDEPSGSMGCGGTSSHTPASSVLALISQHTAQRPPQPATPIPRAAQPAPIWLGQGRAGTGWGGGEPADEVGVGLAQPPAVSQARSISHPTSGGLLLCGAGQEVSPGPGSPWRASCSETLPGSPRGCSGVLDGRGVGVPMDWSL